MTGNRKEAKAALCKCVPLCQYLLDNNIKPQGENE